MTVRVNKDSFNIREKLSELERPIGLNGSELIRAETAQEARDLVSAGRKNLIINGKFQISQRGDYTTSTPSTASTYYLDRWYWNGSTSNTAIIHKINQSVGGYIVNTMQVSCSTAANVSPGQIIEDKNWKHLLGKKVTYSAWVKTNNPKVGLRFYTGVQNIGPRHSGSGNWEYMTWTFTIPSNATVLYPLVDSYTGIFNSITNEVTEITMVQVEEGRNATEFEHRSYGEELALCQRYYQTLNDTDTFNSSSGPYGSTANAGWQYSGSSGSLRVYLPVSMRTNPTATVIGTPTSSPGADGTIGTYGDSAWMPVNSINAGETTKNSVRINVSNLNGSGKDAFGLYFYGSKTTSTVNLNAEV